METDDRKRSPEYLYFFRIFLIDAYMLTYRHTSEIELYMEHTDS